MTRPKKKRSVHAPPPFASFKPTGVRRSGMHVAELELDEYEAIRLVDYEDLDQAEAAARMGISRPTFSRLVEKARQTVARFLVEGRHLLIQGGDVHFRGNLMRCRACGAHVRTAFDAEPSACPVCGADDLEDLAQEFGHGRCCRRHHRRRGR